MWCFCFVKERGGGCKIFALCLLFISSWLFNSFALLLLPIPDFKALFYGDEGIESLGGLYRYRYLEYVICILQLKQFSVDWGGGRARDRF
ncbi:hypothetical protein K440DRAFT_326889 [Wilcoxina mikolae CBS 423.85]|nr:hypothetical protein K440DRAFT_326889 [Wilcoxina mikolae CBS 423.85]